jgi:hypothetical protein
VYKDSTHVFVGTQGHEVVGADPATFEKVDKVTGHNSVFEPEKHGVTFPGHDAVLFRDRMRFYLFEPDYGEMYALESEGVGIVISKPVRTDRRLSVSATLTTSDALSAPALSGAPGNLPRVVPADERSKFKQYLPLFIAAREMMSE